MSVCKRKETPGSMKRDLNQIRLGSAISYVQIGLSILISLFYTPTMIRLLGRSEHGLYTTVTSAISMLSILDLGFGSGYIRYYARYRKENDQEAIEKLNGLFMLIFSVIGCVALLCGLYLSGHLDMVFDQGLTEEEYFTARVLMLLLTANLAISFPMSVFQNIILAHERFIFLKLLMVLKTVVSPMLTLPLLLMGYRSIAMVTVTVLLSLITDCVYAWYCFRHLHCRFRFRGFEPGIIRGLFAYTGFIAVNIIVDQINWNVDKVLIGRYRGTAAVSVYSAGSMIHQYFQQFSTSISNFFTPRVHHLFQAYQGVQEKLDQELTGLFIRVGRVQFLLLALIASGLCLFGRTFFHCWLGDEYADSYAIMLLLVLPTLIPLIQNTGIEIQRAENRHRFRSIAYGLMALLNLGLSIVLCRRYGGIGAALGTALSVLAANGLIMNVYYQKRCGLNIVLFWKNILRMALGLVLPVPVGIALNHLLKAQTWMILILKIVIYSAVYCLSMWLISMNPEEKSIFKKAASLLFHFPKKTDNVNG